MSEKETGGPAFPGVEYKAAAGGGAHIMTIVGGMTLRQHAAIKLRVPDSGTDWLDDMIRKSQRDEFAAKVMPAVYRDFWDDVRANRHGGTVPEDWAMGLALGAYQMADAMLRAREAS
jgi:hypothetical protein